MRRHIVTPHVRWNDQLGDILIKLLIFASFQYLFFKLGRGVLDLYAPGWEELLTVNLTILFYIYLYVHLTVFL